MRKVVDLGSEDSTPCLTRFCVRLLERRAKLGPASLAQVPALETLLRHQIASVAGPKVTTVMKGTQGVDGP
jgi:hypothetical protein